MMAVFALQAIVQFVLLYVGPKAGYRYLVSPKEVILIQPEMRQARLCITGNHIRRGEDGYAFIQEVAV